MDTKIEEEGNVFTLFNVTPLQFVPLYIIIQLSVKYEVLFWSHFATFGGKPEKGCRSAIRFIFGVKLKQMFII